MVQHVSKSVQAVQSYKLLNMDQVRDLEFAKQKVKDEGFDVARRTRRRVRPIAGARASAAHVATGSALTEPESLRFNRLQRNADGFFLKMSYLFRL